MGKRTKYKLRPDGRRETTKTYSTVKKHFYGKTDEEIDAKIAAYEASLQESPDPKVRTFEQAANAWWAEKEPELSPSTVRGYRAHVENAIVDFGPVPVDEITPALIVTALKRLAAAGAAQKVIKNRKIVIKGILDGALIAGEILSNPCVSLPIIKGKPPEKRHSASDADIERIRAAAGVFPYGTMSMFMAFTGCRRGEAVALKWKDIDTKKKLAHICRAVAYSGEEAQIKYPKTDAGKRDVDLYDVVLSSLPAPGDPEAYVFFPDGLPHKGQLERGLRKFQDEHGIDATAHQLRHFYATMLHSAKVDVKDAQTLLGHSSIIMTQDVYTEIERRHQDKVRDSVNTYVNKTYKQKSSEKSSEKQEKSKSSKKSSGT